MTDQVKPDADGYCQRCGLVFEDPAELSHECLPGFVGQAKSKSESDQRLRTAERLIRLRRNVGNTAYEQQCEDWLQTASTEETTLAESTPKCNGCVSVMPCWYEKDTPCVRIAMHDETLQALAGIERDLRTQCDLPLMADRLRRAVALSQVPADS